MNSYVISFLEGNIICQDLYNKVTYKGNEARNFLRQVDENFNNKIYVQGNKLIIRNVYKGYNVEIKNLVQFYLSNSSHLLENTFDTMKKNEEKIQKEKHKSKKVSKNNIIAKIGVSVAPLVMVSMMASGYAKHKSMDNQQPTLEKELIEYSIAKEMNKDINDIINESNKIHENVYIDSINNAPRATLEISDRSKESDIVEIQNKYKDICIAAGKRWGISPNILLGLMTQESHGKEVNLTQIEFDAWKDQVLNVFNYDDNKWMKVVFTQNPEKFKNVDMTISLAELQNPSTNLKSAAMILNYIINLRKSDNIMSVLEEYNKGAGNFKKNISEMEKNTSYTLEDVLHNPAATEFLDYSYVCNAGDEKYVNNVFQYIPNKENGGIYFYKIENDKPKLVTVNIDSKLDMQHKNTR